MQIPGRISDIDDSVELQYFHAIALVFEKLIVVPGQRNELRLNNMTLVGNLYFEAGFGFCLSTPSFALKFLFPTHQVP